MRAYGATVGLAVVMVLGGCGGTPADSSSLRSPTAKTRIEHDNHTPTDGQRRDPVIESLIDDLNRREAKKESPNSKE